MQYDLIAKYYAHYYSTTKMLEKNQIFSVLISRKYGNIFINYIGLVPIEIFVLYCRLYLGITRIVYGLASLICMSKLQELYLPRTPAKPQRY